LFFGLANFGLVGADEPRYAQIAREMLAGNDWVTPRLHGEVWLEKPVLYYWFEIIAYRLFGVSDWAARFPAAVLGVILVAAVYFFARCFRAGSQMEAAVITASSVGVFAFARGVSTDMPLAVFFTLALLAWWAFVETERRRWLLGFYICLALATLAKGPVAIFLAALVMLPFAFISRNTALLLRSFWLPGIALFCLIALPWYVLVQLRNPQFFSEFVLRHNLERFSTDLFRHQRPFWYFVPVLLVGLLPWTALALAGAARAFRNWRIDRERYAMFLLCWGVLPVAFFSLSQSKLPGYILPAVAAWTLLAADYLQSRFREEEKKRVALVIAHAGLSALLVAAVALAPRFMLDRHGHLSAGTVLVPVSLAAAAFLFVAGLILWRGIRLARFATLIPLLICLAYVLRIAAPVVDLRLSARPVAQNIATIKLPIAVFKAPRAVEYGLGFYRNQPIARYERGEIPDQEHFLIAKEGTLADLAKLVLHHRCQDQTGERELLASIGHFPPQKLEYFRVSAQRPCSGPARQNGR
jgi:4-amino-4-deoxy-L-arabinose transferase-like glycosyltransferase